jgi:hypothetical protein
MFGTTTTRKPAHNVVAPAGWAPRRIGLRPTTRHRLAAAKARKALPAPQRAAAGAAQWQSRAIARGICAYANGYGVPLA